MSDLTEREKQVVAWLRSGILVFKDERGLVNKLADAIERGEHLRGGE